MRLTDISLNWLLPGAVLLLGMLAAVAVLARGKRSGEHAKTDDSWERSEERRRRKEALYATLLDERRLVRVGPRQLRFDHARIAAESAASVRPFQLRRNFAPAIGGAGSISGSSGAPSSLYP